MKKFFVNFGKSICYILLLTGVQTIVQLALSMGDIVTLVVEKMTSLGNEGLMEYMTSPQYIADVTAAVSKSTVPTMIIYALLVVGILWIFFAVRHKSFAGEIELKKVSPVSLLPLLPFGAALNFLTSLCLSLLPESWLASYEQASSITLGGDPTVAYFFAVVICAPAVEEVVMRGLVFTRLRRAIPAVYAALLSGFMFGILHGQPVWIAYASVLGIVLALVFDRYRSLWASIVVHVGFNGTSFVLMLLGTDELSGGAAVAIYIISALVAAAVVVYMLKCVNAEKKIAN